MEMLDMMVVVLLVLCLVLAIVLSSIQIIKLSSSGSSGGGSGSSSSSGSGNSKKTMTASHSPSAPQMPSSLSSSWGRGSRLTGGIASIGSIGSTPPTTASDRTALIRDSSNGSGISSSSRDSSNEFGSSGSLVRKYFFVSIAVANAARLISIVVYITTISSEQLVSCSRKCLAFVFICRVIPTSLYLSMYSLLTVFLAQLHHTVSGMPFSRVRILWFFGNILLYILMLIFLVLFYPRVIYMVFFSASLFILCCVGLYSYSIYNQLQAPVLVKVSQKVLDRFVPLVAVCGIALLISSMYFLCMATQLVAWPYGFPQSSLLLFDVASFGVMEIAPSLAIVFFLAYRNTTTTTTTTTTIPSSQQQQSPYMSTGSTTQPVVSTRPTFQSFQSTNVVGYQHVHPVNNEL